MSAPILATKLYLPAQRPTLVQRPHLVARLNAGLHRKLTLVSAAAGFGKTTLVAEWVRECDRPVAWLSLEADDSDPGRFFAYFATALQQIAPTLGSATASALQSPQPPTPEAILTTLLNEIAAHPDPFLLVLDDYHLLEAPPIDLALSFLLEHMPPQMHLVMMTREDPSLPLPRLRARGQLTELRAGDLRFLVEETQQFLNQVMGLTLSNTQITALETRTEGWVAGLQLAGISMQSRDNADAFISSFTGSHHFVLDYLVTEVLAQQPAAIQQFLLHSAPLDRFCAPLLDALFPDQSTPSQETLTYLEQANLFIIPLDNERRWYRYHHLFGELLRQRLANRFEQDGARAFRTDLHLRASEWYEENGYEFEAFHQATLAHDVPRATRLSEGNGMPIHFRGGIVPIRQWLESLPESELNRAPLLWTSLASVLLASGQAERATRALAAAQRVLPDPLPDDPVVRDIQGRIYAIQSTIAAGQFKVSETIALSEQALTYLHPGNLAFQTSTQWKLGYAYYLQGERVATRQAFSAVVATGQATGNMMFAMMAEIGLAGLDVADNRLHEAAERLTGLLVHFEDRPLPVGSEVYAALGRIYYEWNDLDRAAEYGDMTAHLVETYDSDNRAVGSAIFTAQLQIARAELKEAAQTIASARQHAEQKAFQNRLPEIAAVELRLLLLSGQLAAAERLLAELDSPAGSARLRLAQKKPRAALAVLEPYYQEMVDKGWADKQLEALLLLALSYQAAGEIDAAIESLGTALTLSEAGDFVRSYVDEGMPMANLLQLAAARGIQPPYVARLRAAFAAAGVEAGHATAALVDPLSPRELEVLQLVAQGLSNREISERLFLALSTVKGHNRIIYDKLQVQRRTEAVARARELGLI